MLFMFDIGQTLLDNLKPPVSAIMRQIDIPADKKEILKKILFTTDYQSDISTLIRNIEFQCNKPFTDKDKAALISIIRDQEHDSFPMEGSKDFERKVTDDNLNYILVSNIWRPFYAAFRTHFTKFNYYARGAYLSHLIGYRKPYDEFYNRVYAGINTLPENTTIIGDHMTNDIKPVLRRGGNAIWFNHKKEDCQGVHPKLHVVETYEALFETIQTLKHHRKG